MRDSIVIQKIKQVIELIDEIDNLINTQAETLQEIDLELSDWLHFIENNDVTEKQSARVIKRIKELRLIRKSLHKEHAIEKTYKDNSSKMMGNNTRPLLLSEINKTISQWEKEYNNRIITDEQILEIINTPKARKGKGE